MPPNDLSTLYKLNYILKKNQDEYFPHDYNKLQRAGT